MSSTKAADRPGGLSLAGRLALWTTGASFLLVLAAAGVLYWVLEDNLEQEDADFLADQVQILRVLLRDHPGDLSVLRQEAEVESSIRQHARVYIRVLTESGRLLTETPGMGTELPMDRFPSPSGTPERPRDMRSATGKPFEIVSARAPGHLLHVALDSTPENQLLRAFRLKMIPVLAGTLLLSAIVSHRIARRGIRPVEEIAREAGRIRSSTLDRRLDTRGLPVEVATLATTMNDMLARLEEAFARLAQFSADIAHELRTPINTLRGEAEVALGKARTPEEYREVLGSALEEYARLATLIESLLFLARAEDPGTEIRRERLDIPGELGSLRDFYEAGAGEKKVALEVAAAPGLVAHLDRTLFQRAVGNLAENALAHTASGGRITLAASRENGTLRLEVSDTGEGIPPEHLPHVFDRLYRVDRSRTGGAGGAGLGLAIVRSIARLHGGEARIESALGKGTRVTLLLPDRPA
jgi:two-component system heavy metal sensor histidine kinase CusS